MNNTGGAMNILSVAILSVKINKKYKDYLSKTLI